VSAPLFFLPAPTRSDNPFLRDLHERVQKRARADGVTVAQAFDDLFEAIEITEAERTKASSQQKSLRKKLDGHLTLVTSYLSGSYRRRTLIRPLDDIDLLLVLDRQVYGDQFTFDSIGATNALDVVHAALRKAYPKTELKRHGRCVQILFAGTGIGFDVVPSIQLRDDEFCIPDTDLGRWVKTNPKEVERLVTEANAKTDGWLVPLVKLLKAWKDAQGAPIRGYHLEALTYHHFTAAPTNARLGIAELFEKLAAWVQIATPDIWAFGESPSAHLSSADAAKVAKMMTVAAEDARSAIKAEDEDRVDEAHRLWRKLFGNRYPEGGAEATAKLLDYKSAIKAISEGAYVGGTSSGLAAPSATRAFVRSGTSHGGTADLDAPTPAGEGDVMRVDAAHIPHLEWQLARALEQFSSLERLNPSVAALDESLWPLRTHDTTRLYAVLVGMQRIGVGPARRILVTVPVDMPATEPRVYRLDLAPPRRYRPDGRRAATRSRRHQWNDGAMCSHARRDRWDGRLIAALIYAVDWLFRQEYYRRTGRWIGYEVDSEGQLRKNGKLLLRGRHLRLR
jgi:hypothetical protein